MRINKEIRALKVRVIGSKGDQLGILPIREALSMAEDAGLDLVEVVPNSDPPVCKIIDFGKFRYNQTKKDKENKKAQHHIKVKEVKFKPNIDEHDLETKLKQARTFIEKGNKVKITCTFRGREMIHTEIGHEVMRKFCSSVEDIASPEAPLKMMGRSLSTVLAPGAKKKTE
ncbi:MAG: translation initiation factor IF-3 [Parachlamydiales bacterium]|nr:translation initiation factor IF-3 [Parachlamydiales bacterium]